jgi:hypothetical protein
MAVEDRARSSKIEQDHALSDTLTVADADHRQFPRRAREPPRTAPRRRRAWGRRTPGGIDSACAGMADDERPGRPQASRSSSCRPGGRGPGGRADAVRYRRWRPGRRRCRGHPCGRHMFGSGGSRARRRGGELDVTLAIWPEVWRVFHLFAPALPKIGVLAPAYPGAAEAASPSPPRLATMATSVATASATIVTTRRPRRSSRTCRRRASIEHTARRSDGGRRGGYRPATRPPKIATTDGSACAGTETANATAAVLLTAASVSATGDGDGDGRGARPPFACPVGACPSDARPSPSGCLAVASRRINGADTVLPGGRLAVRRVVFGSCDRCGAAGDDRPSGAPRRR